MQARVVVEKIDTESRKTRRTWFTIAGFSCVILTCISILIVSGLTRDIIPVDLSANTFFSTTLGYTLLIVSVPLGMLLAMLCLMIVSANSSIYKKNYGVLELKNGVRIRLDDLSSADLDGLVAKASHIKIGRNQPGSV